MSANYDRTEGAIFSVEPQSGGAIALKSHYGKYVCGEPSGRLVADRGVIAAWEHFRVINLGDGKIALKDNFNKFVSAEPSGRVVADRTELKEWETFNYEAM